MDAQEIQEEHPIALITSTQQEVQSVATPVNIETPTSRDDRPNADVENLLVPATSAEQTISNNAIIQHEAALQQQNNITNGPPTSEPQTIKSSSKSNSFLTCCKKQSKEANEDEKQQEIKDIAEPKVSTCSKLIMIFKIGFLNWLFIIIATIASAGNGAVPVLFYLVLGNLLDALTLSTEAQLRQQVNTLGLYLAIIAVAGGLMHALQSFLLDVVYENVGVQLKNQYFTHLLQQEMGFFDLKKSGALANTLNDDVKQLQEMTRAFPNLVQQLSQAAIGLALAFNASYKMTLIMLASGPVLVIILAFASKMMECITVRISNANAAALATATEVLGAMRTVKSMDGERREMKRFWNHLRGIRVLGVWKGIINSFGNGIITFAIWGDCSLAFWFGGILVSNREITIGQMTQVFGFMLMSVMAVGQGLMQLPALAKAMGSTVPLLKVILRKPQIPFDLPASKSTETTVESTQVELPKTKNITSVAFENVSFKYPTRPTQLVLKSFSCTIAGGTAVALVGPSGSGKSTIMGLLERFYEPESGRIMIDGVDLKSIDPHYLHSKLIAIVNQEPVLFNDTIRNNIIYAVEGNKARITQEEIEAAAKIAYCHEFIMKLPQGYDTIVGERGTALSGGQKQRVAIARAVLQDPKILLLDEATSALDTESEKYVQQALANLMQGRTSICIAHRLATVQDSDVIHVMENGELKETGTHEELINKPQGLYKKLAKKQLMGAISDEAAEENTELKL